MDRLIVKNFGPLKDIDININDINIFIGDNGSGKSVLGKLITILKNPMPNIEKFRDYHIDYMQNDTIIKYSSDNRDYNIEIKTKNLITKDFLAFKINASAQYIPAERNLISLFNRYVTTFITADIPLPKFLLNFSSHYTRARESITNLKFLNIEYQFKNGQEYIFYDNKNALLLENSSSGIQSSLPLYLSVKYFANKYDNIIIEEPEQNLFPSSQAKTVGYIIEETLDKSSLFMMTHSPYVLTALNNLILANDVKEQKGIEAIEGLVKKEACIPFEKVSAYMLVEGKSINIVDREDRLIGINLIDGISDELNHTFDTLLSKLN